MTDGGPPPGMSFPQKIHTDDEDFVIELEDSMSSPPDGYGLDDRSRCKRRKRCGQCGPCQVKENCMKCHFCIRKDVLKQTCIYRKCVYLRSKPKPYSRSHGGSQERGRHSPQRSSPAVKSPPASGQSSMQAFSDQGIVMPDPRPENLFFPPHLPHQQPIGTLQNNGYSSPPNPLLGRGPQPSLQAASNSSVNMNMQMNITPQLQNHAVSPPAQKLSDQSSPHVPQPVNSPPSAIAGIPPSSSCISHIPAMPSVVPAIPPVLTMSSSSLAGMASMPSISNMANMNERAINEFRHPDQLPLPPHHPHHFPSVHTHPHLHREANLFGDPSRVPPHMNYQNHVDPLARGPTDSSCMYHPGLPYSMQGHYQPSGPSFLSGPAEINPFRSNFLNTFPPGYSYPPDRYREAAGFGSLPFSRLGMSPSPSFPQYPAQGTGYGMGNTFSNQYSPYNSQHGCPKNGSRPPVSPSTDDVKVLQEGYKNCEISCESKSPDETEIQRRKREEKQEGVKLPKRKSTPVNDNKSRKSAFNKNENEMDDDSYDGFKCAVPSGMEHLRLWYDFFTQRQVETARGPQAMAWSPWRMTMFSPRHDDVRSRASSSTLSSDFECEVIGIDDHQVNALIRSDGCNSIEIEFDNKSINSSEDASPRKLASRSSALSDTFDRHARPYGMRSSGGSVPRMLSPHPWDGMYTGDYSFDKGSFGSDVVEDKQSLLGTSKHILPRKRFLSEMVCVRQDLGEEGIVQLELPGSKVIIENIVLNEEMLTKSSNVEELKAYLSQCQA